MRALCGAIITAGALIGLGLAALGMGQRYSSVQLYDDEKHLTWVPFHKMDSGLMYTTLFLGLVVIIGLGIAFFGLAYHHHRRHHEHLREEQRLAAHQRTPV